MSYPESVDTPRAVLLSIQGVRSSGGLIYPNLEEIVPGTVGIDPTRGTGPDALFCIPHNVYLRTQGDSLRCPTASCTTGMALKPA